MRLFRLLALLLLLGVVGRLAVRSITVESSDEKVQITIDKQKLKDASHDLEQRGRDAAVTLGQALEKAGKKRDGGREPPETRDK
jgi:single-stranded DNA-binding protein